MLIIKTAWGGKSLYYDFRPPSAGPYFRASPAGHREGAQPRERQSGHYYRLMMEHVKQRARRHPARLPGLRRRQGYEIAGFVWFRASTTWWIATSIRRCPKDSKDNRLRKIQRVDGRFHPRRAQGSRRAENAVRHRRDGRGWQSGEGRQSDSSARPWPRPRRCRNFEATSSPCRPRRSGMSHSGRFRKNASRCGRWAICSRRRTRTTPTPTAR